MPVAVRTLLLGSAIATLAAGDNPSCTTGLHVNGFGQFDGDYADKFRVGYSFAFGEYRLGASFADAVGNKWGCELDCTEDDAKLARGKWALTESPEHSGCGGQWKKRECKLFAVCDDCPGFVSMSDLKPAWPVEGKFTTQWRLLGSNTTEKVDIGCCKRRSHSCDQCSDGICSSFAHGWKCPPISFRHPWVSECCEPRSLPVYPFKTCACKASKMECEPEAVMQQNLLV
eukprot:TRINITY_DN69226_c0_g1_i1.p1 TRINITY_DN69226_c0_g1~~TRINITY_DN69226_c0_g1_i1.p1  ORF type:complete len:229 (+),score=24.67 TRINITY_DN69226_c0_g1_i1:72-758(+)